MRDSLANRVREAAKSLRARGRTFTVDAIAEILEVPSYAEKNRVRNAVHNLRNAGEIQSVSPGVYTYTGKQQGPSKQKVMWNYFRMRMKCGASVTVEELQGAAEVSAEYAKEWLKFLVRAGFVKRLGNGEFQLLKDPVEMPANDIKAARLRSLRKNKREEVMEILEEIQRMARQAQEIAAGLSE